MWLGVLVCLMMGVWLGLTSRIRRRWKVLGVVGYCLIMSATPLWKTTWASVTMGGLLVGLILSRARFFRALAGKPAQPPPAGQADQRDGSRRQRRPRKPSGSQRMASDLHRAGSQFGDRLHEIGRNYREARNRPPDVEEVRQAQPSVEEDRSDEEA